MKCLLVYWLFGTLLVVAAFGTVFAAAQLVIDIANVIGPEATGIGMTILTLGAVFGYCIKLTRDIDSGEQE